jgi:ABC-2 type transport system ATP-binding protein
MNRKYFWIFPEIFNFAPVYYRNNCNAFMIKVTQLRKNYGPVEAVRSIDFEISDGEIVGFLGANGAGKTTTLKMITGYLAPTSGTVEVNGLNISDSQLEIQKQIGYLPETNPLYGEMSAGLWVNAV